MQDRAASGVNGSGTGSNIDTPLTQAGSRDVRRDLLALRKKRHGAESAVGYRCSNLIEQLQNWAKITDPDQRRALEKNIGQSVADLARLTS